MNIYPPPLQSPSSVQLRGVPPVRQGEHQGQGRPRPHGGPARVHSAVCLLLPHHCWTVYIYIHLWYLRSYDFEETLTMIIIAQNKRK